MRSIYFFLGVGVMGVERYVPQNDLSFLDRGSGGSGPDCDKHDKESIDVCVDDKGCGMKIADKDCENCPKHTSDCEDFVGCNQVTASECVACAAVQDPTSENCRKNKCGQQGLACKDCDLADGKGNKDKCEKIIGCNFLEAKDDCMACVALDFKKDDCLASECGYEAEKALCIDCDVMDGQDEATCEKVSGCAWVDEKKKDCEPVLELCKNKDQCQKACNALESKIKCDGSEKSCQWNDTNKTCLPK